jgi:hypothetical protein
MTASVQLKKKILVVSLKGLAANCEATDSEEFSALLKVRLGTEVIFGVCNSARVLQLLTVTIRK